ncbi:MAG: hypothetical protein AUG51_09200 [Acidobacteria bacterium 13_1_20CM_3_53_8]|nr:MAG: hypothetical protein AUG51_09200 [Acidobacteria bacterium 13_1_20CM_3_53_8]
MLNLRQWTPIPTLTEPMPTDGRLASSPSKKGRRRSVRSDEQVELRKKSIRDKHYKILFVDDDGKFRKATVRWLKAEFGLEVWEADSGDSAIQEVKRDNSYDFILLDLMMPPGKDGVETFLELKELNVAAKRVVMMSAHSSSEVWDRAVKLGFQPLSKPLTEVEETLIEIFSGYKG